jgi:hypothetical protein
MSMALAIIEKERGRELILKHGSAELASAALEATYSRLRAQLERHHDNQSFLCWKISVLHTTMEGKRQIHGLQLSLEAQRVGIREAAVEQARGTGKALALGSLQRVSARARQLARMYPFLVLLGFQGVLFRFVRGMRIKSVSRLGAEGLALCDEQTKLLDSLIRHPSSSTQVHVNAFEQQYEEIKHSSYSRLLRIRFTNGTLYTQSLGVIQSFTMRSTPQDMHKSAIRALRPFVSVVHSMQELVEQSERDLFAIQLRRNSLRYGARQYIYTAWHHDFKRTRSMAEHLFQQTSRQFTRLVMQATSFRRITRKPNPSLLRHKGAFLEALAKVTRGMQVIMNIYHEFLPLWALRVGVMSSLEITRQGRVAQKYWLHRFRSDQEHKLRVAELTEISNLLSKVIHCSRPGVKYCDDKDRLIKRARAAIARLSELYRQQYQGVVESDTQERHDVLVGEATMLVRKPTISNVRNTALWQPHRPFRHKDHLQSQPQEMAGSTAVSLNTALLRDIEPNLGSEPAVPIARRIVLWQPYRSTSNQGDPRDTKGVVPSGHPPLSSIDPSSQVQKTNALVSLDDQHSSFTVPQHARQVSTAYCNTWKGMYSAEPLTERPHDFESVMEVVSSWNEAEKRRQWNLEESSVRDKWQNSSAILHYQRKAVEAMEMLGQISPSHRPKSAQIIRAILGKDKVPTSELRAQRVLAALQPRGLRLERQIQSTLEDKTIARKTRRPLRQAQSPLEFPSARDNYEQPRPSRTFLSAKRPESKAHLSVSKSPGRTARGQLRNIGPNSQVKTSAAISHSEKIVSRKGQLAQDQANGLRGLNFYRLGCFH